MYEGYLSNAEDDVEGAMPVIIKTVKGECLKERGGGRYVYVGESKRGGGRERERERGGGGREGRTGLMCV